MAPNLTSAIFLTETDDSSVYSTTSSGSTLTARKPETTTPAAAAPRFDKPLQPSYRWQFVWRNVIAFIYLHVGCLYGIYLCFTAAKLATTVWAILFSVAGGIGVTAGAHRLWSHRAYKAKWPMRLILAVFQTAAFQNHIYEWVRDHRVHHKFSDTDADPHNSQRGFFFSHIGWLMMKKHPDVINRGKAVDMSDLLEDPIVVWQMRTYLVTMPLLCFVVPTWLPCYLWGENVWTSWYVASVMRYTIALNLTWLVNSAAHIWGTRPFDKNISPRQNIPVAVMAFGEGWHNYHHVFPWDYKAAELGNYRSNLTTAFIDFFARIGWAYDLKMVSEDMARRRATRTGDGSHGVERGHDDHSHGESVWGWGDKDLAEDIKREVQIINKGD